VRALWHLVTPHWLALRPFSRAALRRIEGAIRDSEGQHDGEIRFVVEAALPLGFLKKSVRVRAEALFGQLNVWDTEHNSGVLLYVQMVDRRIEIVADRGIAARIEQAEWRRICYAMEESFKRRDFLKGTLEAIERITRLLARHFPPGARKPNELPDKPIVL